MIPHTDMNVAINPQKGSPKVKKNATLKQFPTPSIPKSPRVSRVLESYTYRGEGTRVFNHRTLEVSISISPLAQEEEKGLDQEQWGHI